MTKPAAIFLQLIGLIVAMVGIGQQSWTISLIGAALIIWGGYAIRQRIKKG